MQRYCTSKEKYASLQEAVEVIRAMEDRIVDIGGVCVAGELNVYPCRRCSKWHVGHNRHTAAVKIGGDREGKAARSVERVSMSEEAGSQQ